MALIFVSCTPKDLKRSKGLWKWLEDQGHEGVSLDYDKSAPAETPGSPCEQKLAEVVGRADALVAVVTRQWREHAWSRLEFEKAKALGKPFFPVVVKQGGATLDIAGLDGFDIFDNSPEQMARLGEALSRLSPKAEVQSAPASAPDAPDPEATPQPESEVKPEPETEQAAAVPAPIEPAPQTPALVESVAKEPALIDPAAPEAALPVRPDAGDDGGGDPDELARLKLACAEAQAKSARLAAMARRRRNALAATLVGLAATSIGLAMSERAKTEFRLQRDRAIVQEMQLMAGAARQAAQAYDLVRSMLLALEAFDAAGADAPRQVTASAEAALYSALANNRESVVMANSSPVRMMAFSPDGQFVLMGHGKGTLDPASGPAQVWNARTGAEICSLAGNNGRGIASAGFNPAGDRILTVSQDGAARLWDSRTGAEIAVLESPNGKVVEARFAPGGELAATRYGDGSIRLWRGQTGAALSNVNGLGGLSSVDFAPDGSRFVAATREGAVQIWNSLGAWQPLRLQGHVGPVGKVAFSPTGLRIVTASPDHTARIWDARTGQEVALLSQHRDQVVDAVFSPDGVEALTVSADGEVRIWDAGIGAPLASFKGSTRELDSVNFSPDGGRILSQPTNGPAVKLWDVRTGAMVARIDALPGGGPETAVKAEFNGDGSRLLTVAHPRNGEGLAQARLWNTADGSLLADFGETVLAELNPREPQALTLSRTRGVQLWDTATGKLIAVLAGPDAKAELATFAPTGAAVFTASSILATAWDARPARSIATPTRQLFLTEAGGGQFNKPGARGFAAQDDGGAHIRDAASGGEIGVLKGSEDPLRSLVVSPDVVRVATVSTKGEAWLWRVGSGRQLAVLADKQQGGLKTSFSPDGALLVTISHNEGQTWLAKIWNARTGDLRTELAGHEEELTDASFSADGAFVITASRDGTARIWSVQNGKPVAILKGHDGEVNTAAFSPDGSLAVTAAADGTVRTWDPRTGLQVAAMTVKPRPRGGHEETRPTEARFSPDGGRVLTRTERPDLHVIESLWDARTGAHLRSFEELDAAHDRAVFSGDGAWLMTARRGIKTLWSARTGQRAARSFDHASAEQAKPATDGGAGAEPVPISLAVAADGRRVSVRNARTGAELAVIDPGLDPDAEAFAASAFGAGGKAGEAAVSPYADLLVTASPGRNLLLWEIKGGRLIAVLESPEGEFPRAPAFTQDGSHVFASLGRTGGAMWRVFRTSSALVEEARRAAPRCLSRGERRSAGLGAIAPSWCAELKKLH